MGEAKNIRIGLEFRKIAKVLAGKINEFGNQTDEKGAVETSGDEPSRWIDDDEIKHAVYFADKYHIDKNVVCSVIEMAQMIKEEDVLGDD